MAWRTFMLLSLEEQSILLSPTSSPAAGTHPWALDPQQLGLAKVCHSFLTLGSQTCEPPSEESFTPEDTPSASSPLTHPALRSLCNTARGARCWKGGGGPPTQKV